ncbi:MAG: hypothetical protein IJ833_06655 [Lachnospiraceae bacterium]|nr:hypothetical protein [Lachnospiraceae bacterium]
MSKREFKAQMAEKLVKAAKEFAVHTVGRSIPIGVYEVELPEELKHSVNSDENHQ